MASGALAVIENEPASNVEIWRASTDAANLCKAIVTQRAINLQGKRYVPVEGWQAIAVAHGCVASAENVRRVEGGIAADGVIRRMVDGTEVARAEGFVGEDEPVWFGGKTGNGKTLPRRPDFAIRAMAQTRGISRACRSAFAHVVVMMDVGLETTPYEEMSGVYDHAANGAPEPKRAGKAKDEARAKAEAWTAGHIAAVAEADRDGLSDLLDKGAAAVAKLKTAHPDLWEQVQQSYADRAYEVGDDFDDFADDAA